MFERKEVKNLSKKLLKKHYGIFFAACLIASFCGLRFAVSMDLIRAISVDNTDIISSAGKRDFFIELVDDDEKTATRVFKELSAGNVESARKISDEIVKRNKNRSNDYLGNIKVEYKDGVFAKAANIIMSGATYIAAYTKISSLTKSTCAAVTVFLSLTFLTILIFRAFIVNVYKAAYKRIFLEGLVYDSIKFGSIIHFIKVGKYFKVVETMFLTSLFKFLWMFTIVGGPIKYFSYFLVPYIAAENPDISPLKAIKLSKQMMEGHKMECFKCKLSFVGWYALNLLTLGTLGVFFTDAYDEAFFANYYVYIRREAKEKNIENAELLNDKYLFEKPSAEMLRESYSDIYDLENVPKPKEHADSEVWQFIDEWFGVVRNYRENEQEYYDYDVCQLKIEAYKDVICEKSYPARLNPIPEKERSGYTEYLNYKRHYSVCSLIMLFLILSCIGWVWEVIYYFIKDGQFINRGILHGPWLPIYGSGGALILMFLNKLRSRPGLGMLGIFVLCGTVEYFTAFWLDMTRGEKWWEYSGYFMNINGRICIEGLMFFSIGGSAIVYFIAPFFDNFLRKVKLKKLVAVCAALCTFFVADSLYSNVHPNRGEGITNYETVSAIIEPYENTNL